MKTLSKEQTNRVASYRVLLAFHHLSSEIYDGTCAYTPPMYGEMISFCFFHVHEKFRAILGLGAFSTSELFRSVANVVNGNLAPHHVCRCNVASQG